MPAHSGSVGRPLDNLEVRIVDQDDPCRPVVPQGGTGEIEVRGPSVTPGYFADEIANQSKYKYGWLRTGDLGHLDAEGFLYIDGRIAEFIKYKGIRLSLNEVESFVRRLDGVSDAAAVPVPSAQTGEAIHLLIVPRKTNGQDAEEFVSFLRTRLHSHWPIVGITSVSSLPYTSNGKLDRSAVGALARNEGMVS